MAPPVSDEWRRRNDNHPLHRALGLRAGELGEGFSEFRVVRAPASEGPEGVSTFAVTTAADIALVSAVSTTIRRTQDQMNGTAELNLTYIANPRGEALVRATVLHRGRTGAVVEVRVTDEGGATVAFGRGTYSIRPGAEGSR
jgi:uncharacterized protein (TIGR00369 family)